MKWNSSMCNISGPSFKVKEKQVTQIFLSKRSQHSVLKAEKKFVFWKNKLTLCEMSLIGNLLVLKDFITEGESGCM